MTLMNEAIDQDCVKTVDSGVVSSRRLLLEKAKQINGKRIREIDYSGRLSNAKDKGRIGQVIQVYLGKDPDNDPNADFPEASLELKVTGLLANKKSYRAKERLVLHMIDYSKDSGVSVDKSGLLSKCDTMLITTYQYLPSGQKGVAPDYGNFPIVDSFIYQLTEKDIAIIRADYDAILAKIDSGHAEDLSESDTQYLAACTKGANSSVRVQQPYSPILAKPRAFSLKPSFLTSIIKEAMGENVFLDSVAKDVSSAPSICDKILAELYAWHGKTTSQLAAIFPDVKNPKSKYADYLARMLDIKSLEKSEEFQKANIHIKTVRVKKNGTIEQNMSFEAFDFCDVANTEWDESDTYSYFNGARFLFVVFRQKGKEYFFDKAMFYSLPEIVTDGFVKYTYKKTQATLLSGDIVWKVDKKARKNGELQLIHRNNFVGQSENPVCHVRPHAADFWHPQKDLPVPDKKTGYTRYENQCFWLDRQYIRSILEGRDGDYLMKALESMDSAGNVLDYDL